MADRVLKIKDLSKKDAYVGSGLLRLKNGSFVFDSSSVDFNASLPLSGWTAPANAKDGATATVVFKKGTAYYKYVSGNWVIQKYDLNYYVPIEIRVGEVYFVPENTQILYHEMIDVNGMLDIEGMLIYVGDGDAYENCWWGQILYAPAVEVPIRLFQENNEVGDVFTWQYLDSGNWTDVQVGGDTYDWSGTPGFYRVRQERTGYCTKYSNIVETYNL